MKKVKITVENLKCNGCASTIQKGLLKLKEVENVEIDVETSTVEISYEGNQDSIIEYKSKLAALGYPEAGSKNSTLSKAKSYVSCAIGKVSN